MSASPSSPGSASLRVAPGATVDRETTSATPRNAIAMPHHTRLPVRSIPADWASRLASAGLVAKSSAPWIELVCCIPHTNRN